ncbi:SwmB domain-containing protein, partial [Chloroflexota bacterium]
MDEDGSPAAWDLTLTAVDDDGDDITWSIDTQASNGTATASGTGTSKAIGYTPTGDWNGSDSFIVQVDDPYGGTDTITVNVTVSPRNDAPVNTVAPSITGTPLVGQTLSAADGTWNDDTDQSPGTITYTYQWQRADDTDGTNLADIGGATSSTYVLQASEDTKYVRLEVTATDDGEGLPATASTIAYSSYTAQIGTAPVLQTATVENAAPADIVLTYDKSLDGTSTPATGDFTIGGADAGGRAVSSVAVSGTTVTLTMDSAIVFGNVITISYTAGTNPIQDTVGNDAANLTNQSVTNNVADVAAPVLSTATVENAAPADIVLTYDKSLDAVSVPATGDFTIGGADAGGQAVSSVAVSGTTVTLTMDSAIVFGNVITISYTAGTNPIQDSAGNDAANLNNQAVTNNVADVAAPTNQDTVFASSVSKSGGASVTIVSSGDATNNVWFAPSGTTIFAEGATMTKAASGTATTILAPATAGAYKLFVIDAAGNRSSASTATLTVYETAPTAAITYSVAGPYKSEASVTITATFSEPMADSPVVQIAISGANTLAATDMTKSSTTVYTYAYTVGAGDGTATVALSTGTDEVGTPITSAPTSGATFTVDNTAPTITARDTADLDGDGYIDAIHITFDENIDDTNVLATDFAIAGASGLAFSSTTNSDTADDADIYITFTDGTLLSDAVQNVTYTQGTLADLAGNLLASSGPTASSDKAGPVILTAVASDEPNSLAGIDDDDTVTITFSENTTKPAINAGNIDTVLALNNSHSWLDGASAIGSVIWNTGGNILTVTLSTATSDPTVAVSDTITPSTTITDSGSNTAPVTAVAITGTFSATYQPDSQIKNSSEASYTGDSIYNIDGTSQTKAQTVANDSTATYHLKIENDSSISDTFTVTGTAGSTGWTVSYYNATSGGTDITSDVTGSGWATSSLSSGDSKEIRVEITPSGLAGGSSNDTLVTFTSQSDTNKKDAVKATTTVISQTPVVTIISPDNGLETNSSNITVSGTIVTVPKVTEATLTVNGLDTTIEVGENDAFSATITLIEGTNTIEVSAINGTETGSSTVTVVLDTISPIITITSPANNYITSNSTTTVKGTIDDTTITTIILTQNGTDSTIAISPGVFSVSVNLQQGGNTLRVSATDNASNTGTSGNILVTFDNTKPAVTITSPESGYTTNNSTLTVTGTITSDSPITQSTLLLNGSGTSITVINHQFSENITLVPGVNVVEVRASDNATPPNIGSSGITIVTLDRTAPNITIANPLDGSLLSITSTNITGTIDDSSITSATLKLNGVTSQINISGGVFNVAANLRAGTNTIVVIASDAYGNTGSSRTVTVTVNTSKPKVTITTPATGLVTNSASIAVSGTVVHGQAITGLNLILNGVSRSITFSKTGSGEFGTTVALVVGKNTIVITATDNATPPNKASSGVIFVTRDTVAPVIQLTSPTPGALINETSLTVTGTIDDPAVTTITLTVNNSDEIIPVQAQAFSWAINNLNTGNNTLSIKAVDKAGNTGTTGAITVKVDTNAPKVTITSPENNYRTNSVSLSITGTVIDAPPVTEAILTHNGATRTIAVVNNAFSENVTLVQGQNTLSVTASDGSNTGDSGIITITLDTTPPVLKVLLSDPTDVIHITVKSSESLQSPPTVTVPSAINMTKVNTNTWTGVYPSQGTLAEGSYNLSAAGTDTAGNQASLTVTFSKNTISIAEDETKIVGTDTTTVEIDTTENVTDGSISITQHTANPAENSNPAEEAGIFVEIIASNELKDSIESAVIQVAYDEAKLIALGIDESSLKLYWWNTNEGQYQLVANSYVDTVNNIARATVFHLSEYGIFGTSIEEPSPSPSPPSPPSGGGGGGGGTIIIPPPPQAIIVNGVFTKNMIIYSHDRILSLEFNKGTIVNIDEKETIKDISELTIVEMLEPPDPTEDTAIIGKVYDLSPEGATFNPQLRITFSYDESQLSPGISEDNLILAYWDETSKQWIPIEESIVSPEENIVTAIIEYFKPFAIIAYITPAPIATFSIRELVIAPTEASIGETVTTVVLITNTGGKSGSYNVAFIINDQVEETKQITLDPGESKLISFDVVKDIADTYSIEVGGLTGTFTILEKTVEPPVPTQPVPTQPVPTQPVPTQPVPTQPVPSSTMMILILFGLAVILALMLTLTPVGISLQNALAVGIGLVGKPLKSVLGIGVAEKPPGLMPDVGNYIVENLIITPDRVEPGKAVNIFADVTCTGNFLINRSLVLKIQGIVEAIREITLRPRQSQKVAFTVVKNEASVYFVDFEGLEASFVVEVKPTVLMSKPKSVVIEVGRSAATVGGLAISIARAYSTRIRLAVASVG